MGLFFSKPKNRHRRRILKRSERDWIETAAPETGSAGTSASNHASASSSGARRRKGGRPTAAPRHEEAHQLNAQIGAIETFLAKHHRAEVERVRMRNENILPPIDRSRHRRAKQSVTLAARRKELAERNRTSFRFLMLFAVASALLWWLASGGV